MRLPVLTAALTATISRRDVAPGSTTWVLKEDGGVPQNECITFRNNGDAVNAACVVDAADRQLTPSTVDGKDALLLRRAFQPNFRPELVGRQVCLAFNGTSIRAEACDKATVTLAVFNSDNHVVAGDACLSGHDAKAQTTVDPTGKKCATFKEISVGSPAQLEAVQGGKGGQEQAPKPGKASKAGKAPKQVKAAGAEHVHGAATPTDDQTENPTFAEDQPGSPPQDTNPGLPPKPESFGPPPENPQGTDPGQPEPGSVTPPGGNPFAPPPANPQGTDPGQPPPGGTFTLPAGSFFGGLPPGNPPGGTKGPPQNAKPGQPPPFGSPFGFPGFPPSPDNAPDSLAGNPFTPPASFGPPGGNAFGGPPGAFGALPGGKTTKEKAPGGKTTKDKPPGGKATQEKSPENHEHQHEHEHQH